MQDVVNDIVVLESALVAFNEGHCLHDGWNTSI